MMEEYRAPEEEIEAIRASYQAAFAGGAGQKALEDLRRFCRAGETCIVVGPQGIDVHATLVAEARREVWLRVANALGLDPHTGQKL